jgi:hypothetical protein
MSMAQLIIIKIVKLMNASHVAEYKVVLQIVSHAESAFLIQKFVKNVLIIHISL